MGSGDKLTYGIIKGWGVGLYYDNFPFAHTFSITFIKFYVTIGIGKGYDE